MNRVLLMNMMFLMYRVVFLMKFDNLYLKILY